MHKYCCESRGLVVSGSTTRCCDEKTDQGPDGHPETYNTPTCTEQLQKEIIYLRDIIRHKESINADKCQIISD